MLHQSPGGIHLPPRTHNASCRTQLTGPQGNGPLGRTLSARLSRLTAPRQRHGTLDRRCHWTTTTRRVPCACPAPRRQTANPPRPPASAVPQHAHLALHQFTPTRCQHWSARSAQPSSCSAPQTAHRALPFSYPAPTARPRPTCAPPAPPSPVHTSRAQHKQRATVSMQCKGPWLFRS